MIEIVTDNRANFPIEKRHLEPYLTQFFAFRTGALKWESLSRKERMFYPAMARAWDVAHSQIAMAQLKKPTL